jgi:hypothetical protein
VKNFSFFILFCFCSLFLGAEEKKIALLFLTRSDLNHNQLWKNWIDPEKYNVYNHSKIPVENPWFAQFRIAENHPTEWGFVLLAKQALLRAALKDPSNYKFVFLSESCVPIRNRQQVYEILTADDRSYMRWVHIWWQGDVGRTLAEFPIEHRLGSHNWIILNRKHAEMIVNDDYWIHLASTHILAEEAYFATYFSMLGELHEFKNELTTYVDWQRGSPYLFREASKENLDLLIDAKNNPKGGPWGPRCCLFARKIAPEFPDRKLKSIWKK